MTARGVGHVAPPQPIDGVVPGLRGRRGFPTGDLGPPDPFVMLDQIGPQRPADGWHLDGGGHPHRGFETLTIMFEGHMDHRDSAGNRATLRSGTTQNMMAGSGIQHGGTMAPDPDTGRFHEVQLWVNVPSARKMDPPAIAAVHRGETPIVDGGHFRAEVIAGAAMGATSPLSTRQPTSVVRVTTTGPGPVAIAGIDGGWFAGLYVLDGAVDLDGRTVGAGSTVVLDDDGDEIVFTAGQAPADVLVLAGAPIGEPVVLGGPFVMNTQAEIDQAYADFRAGDFGEIVDT